MGRIDVDRLDPTGVRRPVIDVYARISYAVTGETIKTDDQIELCEEKILARGAVVGEVFRDDSLSAWQPRVVRPDWELMMLLADSEKSLLTDS
jgi:site-specific DNA recombinase